MPVSRAQVEVAIDPLTPVEFPGELLRLDQLADDHAALRYLRRRQPPLDLAQLVRDFDIQFCVRSPKEGYAGRLFIPIYQEGVLKSYQLRQLHDEDFGIKYLSANNAIGQTLYNWDRARKFKALILCEGPTDVWRAGPQAVALYRDRIAGAQLARLREAAAAVFVVLLDPDYHKEEERKAKGQRHPIDVLTDQLRSFFPTKRVLPVWLPRKDPGATPAPVIRQTIRQAAAAAGLTVRLYRWRETT